MFLYIFIVIIVLRIIAIILKNAEVGISKFTLKRKTKFVTGLVVNNFIDSKVLFLTRFYKVPSVTVLTQIHVADVYAFITEKMRNEIVDIHQANMFDHNAGKCYFNVTIVELSNTRMIELGNDYVEVLYTNPHFGWATSVVREFASFKIETDMVETKAPTVIGFARAMQMN